MLHAYRRSNKYQVHSLWFDSTGARTHDLPHSRRTRYPLRQRCGLIQNNFAVYKYIVRYTCSCILGNLPVYYAMAFILGISFNY